MRYLLMALIMMTSSVAMAADEVYQSKEDFLSQAFDAKVPTAKTIWVDKQLSQQIDDVMGHRYPIVRIKYWQQNTRKVFILNEIGKVKPITVGVVIDGDKIAYIKVLTYRESHGWQVKYPFFTKQFIGVADMSSAKIDNISGATMSVDALSRVAGLALFLASNL